MDPMRIGNHVGNATQHFNAAEHFQVFFEKLVSVIVKTGIGLVTFLITFFLARVIFSRFFVYWDTPPRSPRLLRPGQAQGRQPNRRERHELQRPARLPRRENPQPPALL